MYAGQVVEEAPVGELFARPRHPYTQGLIRSHPAHRPRRHAQPAAGNHCRHRAQAHRTRAGLPLCRALQPHAAGSAGRHAAAARVVAGHKVACILAEATLMSTPLLQVKNLVKRFPIRGGVLQRTVDQVHAVDGVSFDLMAGETLGVVGESGCGKSTTGRCILRLIEPTAGEVVFNGRSVTQASKTELRALARDMQIIFQDPYASLNPRMTVGSIMGEALTIHKLAQDPQA
jgi:ABC-type glutathione transport system ATPase component